MRLDDSIKLNSILECDDQTKLNILKVAVKWITGALAIRNPIPQNLYMHSKISFSGAPCTSIVTKVLFNNSCWSVSGVENTL